MDEDSDQKLERLVQSVVVEHVSGFGLIDEPCGVAVEAESGEGRFPLQDALAFASPSPSKSPLFPRGGEGFFLS